MASRRRARQERSGPKNQLWTALLIEELLFDDTPAEEANLVEAADWSLGTGFERATLLRVRGWINVIRSFSSAGNATAFMAIYKTDADDPVRAFDNVAEYVDEDILWTAGVLSPPSSATPSGASVIRLEVDIRVMRKITVSDQIRVSFVHGDAGDSSIVSAVLRSLVRVGGN